MRPDRLCLGVCQGELLESFLLLKVVPNRAVLMIWKVEEIQRTLHFDKDIILRFYPSKVSGCPGNCVIEEYKAVIGSFSQRFVECIPLSPTVEYQHGRDL